jgi:hypothetical protein
VPSEMQLEMQMLNPWLTLSLHATRLGLATQSAMVDQFMRVMGGNASGRREAASDAAEPVAPALTTTKKHTPRAVAQKVLSPHKKRSPRSKRPHSR